MPGVRTSVTLKTLRPLKRYTFKVVTRDKRTMEEGLYYQTFEVFLGEWTNSVCVWQSCKVIPLVSLATEFSFFNSFRYLLKNL